jgi:NDP-sugar pyrophosphorylase family protein
MNEILGGKLRSLQGFGGRISAKERVWIQGESAESMKRRVSILKKLRDKKISLDGSVLIGRHCQIENGATIIDSCIDNYSKIGKNVVVKNSAVMDRAIIGESAFIERSIVGRQVTVNSTSNNPVMIKNLSVIADDVILSPGCHLSKTKVYPHINLPEGEYINETIHNIA